MIEDLDEMLHLGCFCLRDVIDRFRRDVTFGVFLAQGREHLH